MLGEFIHENDAVTDMLQQHFLIMKVKSLSLFATTTQRHQRKLTFHFGQRCEPAAPGEQLVAPAQNLGKS